MRKFLISLMLASVMTPAAAIVQDGDRAEGIHARASVANARISKTGCSAVRAPIRQRVTRSIQQATAR